MRRLGRGFALAKIAVHIATDVAGIGSAAWVEIYRDLSTPGRVRISSRLMSTAWRSAVLPD
jgi:hypothetical protein